MPKNKKHVDPLDFHDEVVSVEFSETVSVAQLQAERDFYKNLVVDFCKYAGEDVSNCLQCSFLIEGMNCSLHSIVFRFKNSQYSQQDSQ